MKVTVYRYFQIIEEIECDYFMKTFDHIYLYKKPFKEIASYEIGFNIDFTVDEDEQNYHIIKIPKIKRKKWKKEPKYKDLRKQVKKTT